MTTGAYARFDLPLTPSQNQLQRWHWAVIKKHRREMATALYAQWMMQHKHPPATNVKVLVDIFHYSPRVLDHGNFVGGCKTLLDAMRDCTLIVNDNPKWLTDNYHQFKSAKKYTEVFLSYA